MKMVAFISKNKAETFSFKKSLFSPKLLLTKDTISKIYTFKTSIFRKKKKKKC